MPISQDVLDLYDQLIATQPDMQRKGATMPYTSLNGHMFSFLTADRHLAARHFETSFGYVSSLKPKPTTRRRSC
jgi:hypothetical protein